MGDDCIDTVDNLRFNWLSRSVSHSAFKIPRESVRQNQEQVLINAMAVLVALKMSNFIFVYSVNRTS